MFYQLKKTTATLLMKSAVACCIMASAIESSSANGLEGLKNYPSQRHSTGYYDILCHQFFPYGALSGGYGNFNNATDNSGETAFTRLALGALWPISTHSSIGAEVGVQSGNQQTLTTDVSSAFGVLNALPISLIVKSPVDVLAILKYQFRSPLFIQAKAGVTYLKTTTESAAITSDAVWNPEIQLGAGFNLSNNVRFVLSYQRFFGQSPSVKIIKITAGTGKITHVPTWQAGMLSVEINL